MWAWLPAQPLVLASTVALASLLAALFWWRREALKIKLERRLAVRVERIADPAAVAWRAADTDEPGCASLVGN